MGRFWGKDLIYPSGPEGCWGGGVHLACQTRGFFVCALKRQGSWSGRAWWVPELGGRKRESSIRDEGKLPRRQSYRS